MGFLARQQHLLPALVVRLQSPMTSCIKEFGPRFDTTATMVQVTSGGHEWLVRQGLIDEFNIVLPPPGYEQARPGESFLKIGVGELVRPDEKPYDFARQYPVRRLAETYLSGPPQAPVFSQKFSVGTDWGYSYRKSYCVNSASATLEIQYQLTNTGRRPLRLQQYNHNWFHLSGVSSGPDDVVETKFDLTGAASPWLAISQNALRPQTVVAQGCYFPFDCRLPAPQNRLRLVHQPSGRGVSIQGDFPFSRFALYAEANAMCPEIFTEFELSPGQTRRWTRQYRFASVGNAITAHRADVSAR